MNSTVEEANLNNSHPWVEASSTNNRYYVNGAPTPSEDHLEASSNSGTNMSASSEEAKFPEYNVGSDGAPYIYTLTTRGRKGSSNVALTADPSDPMQNGLNKYCAATTPWHTLTQGIALMVDSGIRM